MRPQTFVSATPSAALSLLLLCVPSPAQYTWTPTMQLVDNTTWCESNNCLVSIGGNLAEVKASFDGTVYGLTSTGVLQQWTQAGGWVNAPSSLQSPGGNKITHISVGSATEVLALTNAPYPDANIYTLVSGAWQPPSTDPTIAGNLTTAEIAADGSMYAIGGGPYCCEIYGWSSGTGGGWVQAGTGTFQNLTNAGGGVVWAVGSDGYLQEWTGGASWTQITGIGFSPSPAIDALAAVGDSVAAIGTHGGIQVSYNGGSSFSLLDGTACGVSGGDPFLFVRGCNGAAYHLNLLVPSLTATATGSYATWCSGTSGTEHICSEAVHTLSANAHFGGVGGAHGTAGVTSTAQGNPANTLTANATETGTECDPFTEDPDQYSACEAYYSGDAVCSVMGNLGGPGSTAVGAPPMINGVSPASGKTGLEVPVVISGSNFGSSAAALSISGISATVNSVNSAGTQIGATLNLSGLAAVSYSLQVTVAVADGGSSSSNSWPFTVNPAAVPVNFKLTSATDDGGGAFPLIDAFFSWQSSSGNLAGLSSCLMRESVTYPNSNNAACPNNNPPQQCYYPPSPPWPASGQVGAAYPNPTVPTPAPATGGTSEDQNSVTNLSFVQPYSASSFSATQYVQYSCNGGAWTNIYGPITITRAMTENSSSQWQVTVSRSDTSVTSTYVIANQ